MGEAKPLTQIFVLLLWEVSDSECDKYIRIFEYLNIFDPNIYSDIRSYHFLETNIFEYSFVNSLDTNIFGYSFIARF